MIRILQRRQIDDKRWNEVISSSLHETIYPYTWYMDACSDNWCGFVKDDYEYIMPVAFRKKLGLKYCYQPVYCQQLGVYSKQHIDPEVSRDFLLKMSKSFKIGDYAFNEQNILGEEKGFDVSDNTNYILSLADPYDSVLKNYSENCRRNLKRAYNSGLEFTDKISLDEIVSLKRVSEKAARNEEHYAYVARLFSKLNDLQKTRIFGAKIGNHLVAAAIFAFSEQRSIFLLSASSERGKEQRAMFLVVDAFIQMYSGTIKFLDFEGSNIASIARFFRGFGAKPQIYQRVSIQNSTSRIVKLVKGV